MPVAPQRQVTARLLLMAGLISGFALAWRHFASVPMLVIGQPKAVGLLQRDQEEPFFRNLATISGLPLKITYQTTDSFGLKDTHQLDALRDGRIDIVSLRFMQNAANEPSLEGIDLPGTIPDFQTARLVSNAYGPTVDRQLQKDFSAKLLGIWSFGPQVMLCKRPISGLRDLRGRRIRVASPGLAELVSAIGGMPAVIAFEDTRGSLASGIVDCAVTSAASASFAGWTHHTQYYYPLAFQFGFNGYAISLKSWRSLSTGQQQQLSKAFRDFSTKLWVYTAHLQQESEQCILGGHCRLLQPQRLTLVRPSSDDVRLLQSLSQRIVLPRWSAGCEQKHPGCRREWEQKVAANTQFIPTDQEHPQ